MASPESPNDAGGEVEIGVVATPTHGRYLLRRSAVPPELLLVGFHGYRENAMRHLAELERIPGAERRALLTVDALSSFYAGSTGEVLRGWMTRELREEAIEDNVAYVRRILDRVRPDIGWTVPLAFLGFSQGASMAWRAALLAGHSGAEPAKVIALAGDIPPELAHHEGPFPQNVLLAHGDKDDWYSGAKLHSDVQLLQAKGIRPQTLVFAGGHEWTEEFRQTVAGFLAPAPTSGPDPDPT